MGLPKEFGAGGDRPPIQKPAGALPRKENLYGDPPSPALPSFDELSEEDPFSPISPNDAEFYSQESLQGSIEPARQEAGPYNIQTLPTQNTPIKNKPRAVPPQQVYNPREEQQPLREEQQPQYPIDRPYPDTPNPRSPEESYYRDRPDQNFYPEGSRAPYDTTKEIFEEAAPIENRSSEEELERRVQERLDQHAAEAQRDFVDKKKKKLLPFGSGSKREKNSKKKKVKVNDFDSRKNLRNRNKAATFVVIIGVILLILFAVYKVFLSKDSLSEDKVASIAMTATGSTNFPIESGAAIAESFMEAYLTTNDNGKSDLILAHYYGVDPVQGTNVNIPNRIPQGDGYTQRVISGPVVFEEKPLGDSSAAYTVGALVSAEPPKVEEGETPIPTKIQWLYFNVNIYYNEENNTFSIPGDSPTVVPAPAMVPIEGTAAAALGNGEENKDSATLEKARTTIELFFEKYAISSNENFNQLEAFTTTPIPKELMDGLNGQYTMKPEEIEVVLYNTDYNAEDPSAQLKALVKVPWRYSALEIDEAEASEKSDGVVFVGTYVVTLDDVNGAYKISKMAPFYFTPAEKS